MVGAGRCPSIDGRTEIYSPEYVRSQFRTLNLGRGWRGFVRRGKFDAAILGTGNTADLWAQRPRLAGHLLRPKTPDSSAANVMNPAKNQLERHQPPNVVPADRPEPSGSGPSHKSLAAVTYRLSAVGLAAAFSWAGLRPVSDPDLGWHLRTGQLVLQGGFPTRDTWSFASTERWVLHEWLGEVVLYLASAVAGDRGVIALRCVTMLVLASLVITSSRREGRPWPALVVAGLALWSLLPRATNDHN